ncbi:MAG: hypothetical protein ABIH25_02755 [Candidatus Woesearchaeota archaeon]
MKDTIRKDIISALKESITAIKKNDLALLREQSNEILNNTLIYQDKSSISLAVIIYSIFKILEKKSYTKYKDWNIFKVNIIKSLRASQEFLEKGDLESYYERIKAVMEDLNAIEKDMGLFIEHIINSSKIKKASQISIHGLSGGRVAEMLGISQWELMSYIGQNKEFTETPYNISKSVLERVAYAKKIFNLR